MKKIFLIIVAAIFLSSCTISTGTAPEISELEYKQALGLAICTTIDKLNELGELADETALERDFNPLLEETLNEMGYPSDEWLAAKAYYFPDEEEHTKLVKMHFAWCLVGNSFTEEETPETEPAE